MIFVTVGLQLPFDRLIAAMDELAPQLSMPVVAQTGQGDYGPKHVASHAALPPAIFEKFVSQSAIVVSHAGIGTILAARQYCKPLVILPRSARLSEHRNDHQQATAKHLAGRNGIFVAADTLNLHECIRQAFAFGPIPQVESFNVSQLRQAITHFVEYGEIA